MGGVNDSVCFEKGEVHCYIAEKRQFSAGGHCKSTEKILEATANASANKANWGGECRWGAARKVGSPCDWWFMAAASCQPPKSGGLGAQMVSAPFHKSLTAEVGGVSSYWKEKQRSYSPSVYAFPPLWGVSFERDPRAFAVDCRSSPPKEPVNSLGVPGDNVHVLPVLCLHYGMLIYAHVDANGARFGKPQADCRSSKDLSTAPENVAPHHKKKPPPNTNPQFKTPLGGFNVGNHNITPQQTRQGVAREKNKKNTFCYHLYSW